MRLKLRDFKLLIYPKIRKSFQALRFFIFYFFCWEGEYENFPLDFSRSHLDSLSLCARLFNKNKKFGYPHAIVMVLWPKLWCFIKSFKNKG